MQKIIVFKRDYQTLLRMMSIQISLPTVAGNGQGIELPLINDVLELGKGKIVKDGKKVAILSFGGGCQGCGASASTLQHGIRMALMDEFKEINEVLDATDHSAGENPFYLGNPFK